MSQSARASTHFHEFSVLLTSALAEVVNKALQYDPGTQRAIARLPTKTLGIISHSPALEIYIRARGNQLVFTTEPATPTDVVLQGELRDILSLVFTASTSLANTGVTVKGQIGLLADYQRCFQRMEIDWQDALASVIGGIPAHILSSAGRYFADNWLPDRNRSADKAYEFLTEELRALPGNHEIQAFGHEVSLLRQNVDRLQLRLDRLRQQKHT